MASNENLRQTPCQSSAYGGECYQGKRIWKLRGFSVTVGQESTPRALAMAGECLMGMRVPSSLHASFAPLTAPRCPAAPKSRHRLRDILVLAVCAGIGGAEGWEDLDEYGKAQAAWLADLLDLPHGMPGHDTFRRGVSRLAPEALIQCFLAWTQALSEASGGAMIAIDGKTLRHAFEQATSTAALPMVRAWARANRLVLGPLQVEEQSTAITAIPQLLHLLDLTGAVGTSEAMGGQREIAKTMTERGAEDV